MIKLCRCVYNQNRGDKMKREKLKKIIALGLLVATVLGGAWLFKPINQPIQQNIYKTESTIINRHETIASDLQQMNKLIFCQSEMNEAVDIISGVQNRVFMNNTTVTFYANTYLTIDMSRLDSNNVSIDDVSKVVRVYAPKPETIIEFDESKTTYEAHKGVLTKLIEVDNKLTVKQYEVLKDKVKRDFTKAIENKINDSRLLLQKSIEDTLFKTTGQKYIIIVQFVY